MRSVEANIEEAIEKAKAAVKELTKAVKELSKVIDGDQKALQKYYQEYSWLTEENSDEGELCMPSWLCRRLFHCLHHCCTPQPEGKHGMASLVL